MSSEARKDGALWCVSIQGPDDVVAVADYLTAVKVANAFNGWWQKLKEQFGQLENDPRMWAMPIEWMHGASQHAASVANPSTDYAPFISKATGVGHE